MAQFLRPISDKSISGTWVNQSGGSTNLYLSIDEVTSSDADYIQTGNNPGATDYYEGDLTTGNVPDTGNHIARYRIAKSATAGRTIQFTVHLYNADTTEIAMWTHSNMDAVTTYAQTLTSGQIAAITSYTGMYMRINPTTSGGGATRAGRCFWFEFEIPDPVPDPTKRIKIGGVWKEIIDMKTKQGGVWKNISSMQRKIGGSWKVSQ